jgi:hypothetical protein
MTKFNQGRPEVVCDTECYVDYWSIGFMSLRNGQQRVYEHFAGNPLNTKAVAKVFREFRVYTFNGIQYDIPMILLAMSGASNGELKAGSDDLIIGGTPWWVFLDRHGLSLPDFFDHVDLMQVSPGAPQMPSLKIYAGRMHSKKMQELPIEVDERIVPHNLPVIRPYHGNDLHVTADLKNELAPQVDLRCLMSDEYGVDLRSKSDAQIAEAVIKAEIEKVTGTRLYKPDIEPGLFNYIAPEFLRFETAEMQQVLERIKQVKFVVDRAGVVKMPEYLKDLEINLGYSVYRMGIGGLHSSESCVSHFSDDEYTLRDRDMTSYYPNIKMLLGLYPKRIGPAYLNVYKRIYERRVAAKRAGQKNIAETLKIVLNGAFGKLGSPYSVLYAPNLMIQTTITGQLAILMLIERIEAAGMDVVSANTDGFVTKVPRARYKEFDAICLDWELDTGFNTEETEYHSLHSRDVNSYIAIANDKGKTKVKLKGAYTASGPGQPGASGLKKNPDMDVCVDAVVAYLKDGTPIEDTIEWCTDVRKFITVRRVKGGAVKDDEAVGKAIRWYYSTETRTGFHYKTNGNAVPRTIGAKPMLELDLALPPDLDYDYYIREAYAILQDIGMNAVDPKLRGRSGRFFGRLPKQKNIHIVDAGSGVALCGKTRESIRDSWEEYHSVPSGHRLCSKCRKEEL